jgi:hypothetical protein
LPQRSTVPAERALAWRYDQNSPLLITIVSDSPIGNPVFSTSTANRARPSQKSARVGCPFSPGLPWGISKRATASVGVKVTRGVGLGNGVAVDVDIALGVAVDKGVRVALGIGVSDGIAVALGEGTDVALGDGIGEAVAVATRVGNDTAIDAGVTG